MAPLTRPTDDRPRRADAERNIAAILDAAIEVLGERPAASMEDVAKVAGVARQTVYAHYPSREELLRAVQERALAEAVAGIDAARPEEGPPAAALDRLVAASWETLERHARLLDSLRAAHGAEELHEFHRPILQRLERLIRRGKRAGVFDRQLPTDWILAAVLGLFHATAEQVGAGRVDAEDGAEALGRAIPRLLGVED